MVHISPSIQLRKGLNIDISLVHELEHLNLTKMCTIKLNIYKCIPKSICFSYYITNISEKPIQRYCMWKRRLPGSNGIGDDTPLKKKPRNGCLKVNGVRGRPRKRRRYDMDAYREDLFEMK